MGICKCEVATDAEGMMTFSAKGKKVALRMPSGRVVDLRLDPPFVSISPCPWCVGIHGLDSSGKEHDALSHIDPDLGTDIAWAESQPKLEPKPSLPMDPKSVNARIIKRYGAD